MMKVEKSMRQLGLFAIAALVCVGPAVAQDAAKQTPENAHRFLRTLSDQGSLSLGFWIVGSYSTRYASPGWNRFELESFPDNGRHTFPSYKINGYSTPNTCTSLIKFDKPPTYTFHNVEFEGPFTAYSAEGFRLEWGKVREVRARGYDVEIVVAGGLVPEYRSSLFRISFGGEDLAQRAALAMTVIKQSCDPVGDTGF